MGRVGPGHVQELEVEQALGEALVEGGEGFGGGGPPPLRRDNRASQALYVVIRDTDLHRSGLKEPPPIVSGEFSVMLFDHSDAGPNVLSQELHLNTALESV